MVADSDDVTRTSNEHAQDASLPSQPQRLVAPLQVRDPDRYNILGEHGRGGLGKVARAHDKELGRNVAIKELIKRGDIGSEIRFLREAMITARLEHPSIVPIHEAGRWPDGTPFYVMKLVAGRSLKELLAQRRNVEERIALLHHVVAVADAVAYAHKRKIIHRDLKPANVIVGDFGETIVIDWGLAKDLSQPGEVASAAGPYRTAALSDLTETGTVLGTPMYMPPEQWRGEAVDERADVFAIGAMLWELCSMSRVPPTNARHRDRLLRKAGIDKDLCAILIKALSPEPRQRYSDAGELAVDLKAFTSGARIASRRYSLLAMVIHWMRRHRALAITIFVGLGLATVGTAISVLNITSARDRAEIAQRRAEEANAELALENAELLMTRDPTAVVAALAHYRGGNHARKQRLLAEARGRGVADAILQPHSDTIWFVAGDASGAIFSLGEDLQIRVTKNGISETLANDVAPSLQYSYASQRHLLAYATKHERVSLLDLRTRAITTTEAVKPAMIMLSPDGTRLAVKDAHGQLTVWPIPSTTVLYRATHPKVWNIELGDPDRLVLADNNSLHSISLKDQHHATIELRYARSFDARRGNVVTGDGNGTVTLLTAELHTLGKATVCRDMVSHVRLFPMKGLAAFACKDGLAGVLRYEADSATLAVDNSFPTGGSATHLEVDVSGQWVLATGKSNLLHVYNLKTQLVAEYRGHVAHVNTVAPPMPDFEHIITGDVNGAVRVWPLPAQHAEVIFRAPKGLVGLAITPDDSIVAVGGHDRAVHRIDVSTGHVLNMPGHSNMISRIGASTHALLTYGVDGTIRTWTDRAMRVFTEHSVVNDAAFLPDGKQVASVGDDGRMFVWPIAGDRASIILENSSPLLALEVIGHNSHIVTHDDSGVIWDVSPQGAATRVRTSDGLTVTVLRASPSGRRIAVGTSDESVTIYNTETWSIVKTIQISGNVRQIAFAPDERDLMIASETGILHAVALDSPRRLPWHTFPAHVRDVKYHPSGNSIAFVCADGGAWFYSISANVWAYTRDHNADTLSAAFSHDGTKFVSLDTEGIVTMRDVSSTMAAAMPNKQERISQ